MSSMVAYRLSVAYRGSVSLSKRVEYDVTERMRLEVGPVEAQGVRSFSRTAAARSLFS